MIWRIVVTTYLLIACVTSKANYLHSWVGRMESRSIHASVGIWDLVTGKLVEGYQSDLSLVPASTTKLLSTYALLKTLKPNFQLHTELWGDLRGSTIFGDLIIRGVGDPCLTSERIWLLANELKMLGVTKITGRVRLDQSAFDNQIFGNGWQNTSMDTTPPVLPLSVNFNRENGKIVQNPGELAVCTIQRIIRGSGISILEVDTLERPPIRILSFPSLPLRDLITSINKISNNFMIEMLVKYFGGGSWPSGITRIQKFYENVLELSPDKITITDGSGLSKDNRISARTLAIVLRAAWNDFEVGPEMVGSLKTIGGESWNLHKTPHLARRIRCKTGHLRDVTSVCGYLQIPDGRLRVFAILLNGPCQERDAWELIEKWVS
jgi:D-alanyl-D-alanine carboxypeptidase/D-alanyl-D-alanine-endopeptidase (penicillin-binding protein 4)